jgi:hypothetical protein
LGRCLAQSPVAAAQSASSVTVKADQATLVAIAGDPATVVVGNSLFADVSMKQGMIVIHGRHFGTTNVIVLDQEGTQLASFEVNVVRGGSQNVTIYKAGSAFSYLCAPACESALQVGDDCRLLRQHQFRGFAKTAAVGWSRQAQRIALHSASLFSGVDLACIGVCCLAQQTPCRLTKIVPSTLQHSLATRC